MVKLNSYISDFEDEYWDAVNKKICPIVQKKIVTSCENFLPNNFFNNKNDKFKQIVLSPYQKLKNAKKHIDDKTQKIMLEECFDHNPACPEAHINDLYRQMYNAFDKVADSQKDKTTMRVRIVKEADITVCPYCNREYINCRTNNVSGVQLDHFFSRAKYPIFAVSLYNLVPACGNCNRIKNANTKEFASPFDPDIDWDNAVRFGFQPKGLDDFQIKIEVTSKKQEANAIRNNISEMHIEEAYQIHSLEIKELQNKKQAYSETQINEIRGIFNKYGISDDMIKKMVFGPEITLKDMRKKPLGKMVSDWHKKWGIY